MRYILLIIISVCFTGMAFSMSWQYPTWENQVGVTYTSGEATLMHTGTLSGWKSGARSQESLSHGTDGAITYVISQLQPTWRAFGFGKFDNSQGFSEIAYSFMLAANNTARIMNYSTTHKILSYNEGDILKVAIVAGIVEWSINGKVFYSMPNSISDDLFVDTSLKSKWGYLDGLKIDFGLQADIQILNESGGSLTNNVFSKTKNDGWGNCGFSSKNVIEANEVGWVEAKVDTSSQSWSLGLSTWDEGTGSTHANFSLDVRSDGFVKVLHDNVFLLSTLITHGDLLRIERWGSFVRYYHNDQLLAEENYYSRWPLVLDLSMYNKGSKINLDNIHMSSAPHLYAHVQLEPLSIEQDAQEIVRVYGEKDSIYFWGNKFVRSNEWNAYKSQFSPEANATLSSVGYSTLFLSGTQEHTSKAEGNYHIYVQDNTGDEFETDYLVGYKLELDTIWGIDLDERTLKKTSASSYANSEALFQNGFLAGRDTGSVVFHIPGASTARSRIGFRSMGDSKYGIGAQIKYGIDVYNGSIKAINNGALSNWLGRITGSDQLTFKITSTDFEMYINGALFYTTSIASNTEWVFDVFMERQNSLVTISHMGLDNYYKPRKPLRNKHWEVKHWTCDGQSSSFKIQVNKKPWCNFAVYVVDQNDIAKIYNPNMSGDVAVFNALPVGDYNVYLQTGCGQQTQLSFLYSFTVGYVLEFESNPLVAVSEVLTNINYEHTGTNYGGAWTTQNSINRLMTLESGWMEFDVVSFYPFEGTTGVILEFSSAAGTLEDKGGVRYSHALSNDPGVSWLNAYYDGDANSSQLWQFNVYPQKLRVERTPAGYNLYRDGILVHQGLPNQYSLSMMQAALRLSPGTKLRNPIASFGCIEPPIPTYAEMSRGIDGGAYVSADGEVHVILDEEYTPITGDYKLTLTSLSDIPATTLVVPQSLVLGNQPWSDIDSSRERGDNYLTFNIASIPGIDPNAMSGFYLLKYTSAKEDQYYLKILVQ